MSSLTLTTDQALDHVRRNLDAGKSLVGNVRIQDMGQLEVSTVQSAMACFLEAADLFEKLDTVLRRGGEIPVDWAHT